MTVGVMVGAIIASTIVRLSFGYSFSTWRFHQRGLGIRSPHDVGWLADMTVSTLMRSDPKIISEKMSMHEIREKFPRGSAKRVFVVDENGCFVGAIDLSVAHDSSQDPAIDLLIARDLVTDSEAFLLPMENVKVALLRFDERQLESLPVVKSRARRELIGYMTEAFALRRYTQELERRRNAELGERDLFSIAEPPA